MNILKLSLLTGALCPAPLLAQTVDNLPEASQDRDIVVTASGTEQPVEESGQAVTVITRDQIQEHRFDRRGAGAHAGRHRGAQWRHRSD